MQRITDIDVEHASLGEARVAAHAAVLEAKKAVKAAEEALRGIRNQRLALQVEREVLITEAVAKGGGWKCPCSAFNPEQGVCGACARFSFSGKVQRVK